jgi:hypothetical protein
MKTYIFSVTYTNDKRTEEVKARSEQEAKYLLECRAKKALMQIVNIDLINTLNK